MFKLDYHNHSISEFKSMLPKNFVSKGNGHAHYLNVPCAFDTETTSFSNGSFGTMWIWQFGINGIVTTGRTWPEFINLLQWLKDFYHLSNKRRLLIYDHNLAFEFQFFRKWLTWKKVFCSDPRKPIYALTDMGIEFRDSLILSGYSLDRLGKELHKYHVRKMTGDLDYSLKRNRLTTINKKETGYVVNDVLVVMAYVKEMMEQYNNSIAQIPLTKTGIVRREARKKCLLLPHGKHNLNYRDLMSFCTINDLNELDMLHRAFQGGFTHANPMFSRCLESHVGSFDFTSSYPTVMISEKYPMSRGRLVTITSVSQFHDLMHNYCCVFDVKFIGLRPKVLFDNILSYSNCYGVKNYTLNNGRVFKADVLYATITNIDYWCIRQFYTWKEIHVNKVMVYKPDYLPKPIVQMILELYEKKTKLKGIPEKHVEYMQGKAMLNSMYGMCVTDIVRDEINYKNDSGWDIHVNTQSERAKLLYEYNHNKHRFLFYPWGVFVTAYARRNLFRGILEFKNDYLYSDTDSIKAVNWRNHLSFIKSYNKEVQAKCAKVLQHYGLDTKLLRPKTIEGVEKPIGVWDFEGEYEWFKTIGAKRYFFIKDGKLNITVAGLGKKAEQYFEKRFHGDVHKIDKFFDFGMTIPSEYTGKLLHTYNDDVHSGKFTDYQGHTANYLELSSMCLEPEDFHMLNAMGYLNFLKGYFN